MAKYSLFFKYEKVYWMVRKNREDFWAFYEENYIDNGARKALEAGLSKYFPQSGSGIEADVQKVYFVWNGL